jgi:hypothetical protein
MTVDVIRQLHLLITVTEVCLVVPLWTHWAFQPLGLGVSAWPLAHQYRFVRLFPEIIMLFAWLISQQPAVLSSQNKPATSNQPAVLSSQNKPAISHQPNEQADFFLKKG